MRQTDLQSENEELKERIRQLEAMLGQTFDAHRKFGLTKAETKILGVLARVQVASRDAIHSLLYFDRPNDVPDINIVNCFICKLRKKLRPHGIAIETDRNSGYFLSSATKAKLAEISQ